VELVEPLGDQTHLTLQSPDGTLVARVEPAFRPAVGAPLEAWLDHVHRFDPETGERLTP
jgi:hypothetical protein